MKKKLANTQAVVTPQKQVVDKLTRTFINSEIVSRIYQSIEKSHKEKIVDRQNSDLRDIVCSPKILNIQLP